ncbi:hypothetical protein [Caballeronia pedi]|uniref:hypothetical protein n=1 Tax=Caballeronia pedi TaxID=1777141 RepID=UPI00142D7F51|nr:hypothetical protein [Caballeronia pedi]
MPNWFEPTECIEALRAGRSDIGRGLAARARAADIVHVFVPVRLNPAFLFSKDFRADFIKQLSFAVHAQAVNFFRDF